MVIRKLAPDYMPMGSSGMGDMAHRQMPGPANMLPMMTGSRARHRQQGLRNST